MDGNAKMCLNSKNASKKTCAQLRQIDFFYLIRKRAHKLQLKHIYSTNPSMHNNNNNKKTHDFSSTVAMIG